jgi:serine/threonine protein kinase
MNAAQTFAQTQSYTQDAAAVLGLLRDALKGGSIPLEDPVLYQLLDFAKSLTQNTNQDPKLARPPTIPSSDGSPKDTVESQLQTLLCEEGLVALLAAELVKSAPQLLATLRASLNSDPDRTAIFDQGTQPYCIVQNTGQNDCNLSFSLNDDGSADPSQFRSLESAFLIERGSDGQPILLGSGGMGDVMLGTRIGEHGSPVAIKVCREPANLRRFLQEYNLLKELSFEGFAGGSSLGLFQDESGRVCYSMKLVDGYSLSSLYSALHKARRGDFENEPPVTHVLQMLTGEVRSAEQFGESALSKISVALVRLTIDIAGAVSNMHKKHIVHRDLKPGNIFVERISGNPIILDVGLAKKLGGEDPLAHTKDDQVTASGAQQTRAGAVIGTYAYMSPEQARGDPGAHTQQTDIYALGAMLYHLITGELAVSDRDNTGRKLTRGEIEQQISRGNIKPAVVLPAFRRQFPDLAAICSKAMAKEPAQRYQTVDAMVRDLQAWTEGKPVAAYRDATHSMRRLRYEFFHWKRENPGRWAGFQILTLSTLTALGGGTWWTARERNKAAVVASVAQRSLMQLSGEAEKGLRDFLGTEHTVNTMPVEKLDRLISDGKFKFFLSTALERIVKEIPHEELGLYRQHSDIQTIRVDASKRRQELEEILRVYNDRVDRRTRMKEQLENFRERFQPINDFLGNDLTSFLTDAPQERIDDALAFFLEPFRTESKPSFYFPECSSDMQALAIQLRSSELTPSEIREIEESIAKLLLYKTLNLPRGSNSFAPHVTEILPGARDYLDLSHRILDSSEGGLTVVRQVLASRIASALDSEDKHSLQLRVTWLLEQVRNEVADGLALSDQDLGALATELFSRSELKQAHALYQKILDSNNKAAHQRGNRPAASLYLGYMGVGKCCLALAHQSFNVEDPNNSGEQLLGDASEAYNRAIGLLSLLPDDSTYKNTMLAACHLGLAATHMYLSVIYEESNPGAAARHRQDMREHHEVVLGLSSAPRFLRGIAMDLVILGENERAITFLTDALAFTPTMERYELLALRATCHARLTHAEGMENDISTVLQNPADAAPRDLWQCALAVDALLEAYEGSQNQEESIRYYVDKQQYCLEQVLESIKTTPFTKSSREL